MPRERRNEVASQAVVAPATAEGVPARRTRDRLVWMGLLVIWTGALLLLVVMTANPVVVSADQIRSADCLVVVRVTDARRGRVAVEESLRGAIEEGTQVTILNLEKVEPAPRDGDRMVMPLTRFRHDYTITVLAGQLAPPLVYAADRDTISRVRHLALQRRP